MSPLTQRILTALVLASAVAALILRFDDGAFAAAIGAFIVLAAREWAVLSGIRSPERCWAIAVAMALLLAGLFALLTPTVQFILAYLGLAWWVSALFWLRHPEWGGVGTPTWAAGKLALGLVVLIPAWAALVSLHAVPGLGPWLVLSLFTLLWVADSGAYFVGRSLGQRPLAPRVSPGKTVEGALGAIGFSLVWALAGGWLFDFSGRGLAAFTALGVLVAAISVVGDLVESIMKRQAGMKDSGKLLPGHGGVLDRIDSLAAAAPAFFIGYAWLAALS